ncbi:MAG: TIGR03936 family radical SAM-associated protein [Clostridiales bacterium]
MTKIRVKFLRGEKVKYISHLDLMKVFERALKRADLPIDYSNGFNPHPKIVFGLPLSVGVTSESEFVDFQFKDKIIPVDFIKRVNTQLPQDVETITAKEFDNNKNIMNLIERASYEIEVSFCKDINREEIDNLVEEFLNKNEIIVSKKAKKKLKDINIRPLVHKFELKKVYINNDNYNSFGKRNIVTFFINVSAGTRENLKPELFIKGLMKILNIDIKIINIHRTGLYVRGETDFVNPLDDSVL